MTPQGERGREPKVKPISFKEPLVRAILEGRKTQTRRVMNPQPANDLPPSHMWLDAAGGGIAFCRHVVGDFEACRDRENFRSPHGMQGGLLWVKEPLQRDGLGLVEYAATPGEVAAAGAQWPWKPKRLGAMYCPRWASRIDLEITEVRVQRLRDLSLEDARAEGMTGGDPFEFQRLWDQLNGKRPGCSWKDSPWVWAISFRRVRP